MNWKITTLASVDSTNTYLSREAAKGAPEGSVVRAVTQSAGRGRQGRTWISRPEAGLYFSILLRPPVKPEEAITLPLVAGLAVAEALQPYLPDMPLLIKWPNDILLGSRKLSGILCEMNADMSGLSHVIIGIGVNVNLTTDEMPQEIANIATSLIDAAKKRFEIEEVLHSILKSFEAVYASWLEEGFAAIHERISARDALIGKELTIELIGEPISGKAVGIAKNGALLLQTKEGSIKEIISGEAHLRK